MNLHIALDQEADGRWMGEVSAKVQALRVVAERLEHTEAVPELLTVSFDAA